MSVLEQVAQLKTQAVELLLSERDRIDAELAILGQEKATTQKRRGRPPLIPSDQRESSRQVSTLPTSEPASSNSRLLPQEVV